MLHLPVSARLPFCGFYAQDLLKAVSGDGSYLIKHFGTTLVLPDGNSVAIVKTVRNLIEAGLIRRTKDDQSPYALTKAGREVMKETSC